jgi:hypothetical protein
MSAKKYAGSCHCGKVKFEAILDLAATSARCNCSYCAKARSWNFRLPSNHFRILSGETELGDYQFGDKQAHHRFCKTCGIRVFTTGFADQAGSTFAVISAAALDEVPAEVLASIPVRYMDGGNNNWGEQPMHRSYL